MHANTELLKFVCCRNNNNRQLVIILQCHWRRWLARNYVKDLREDKENRIEWERKVSRYSYS